MKNLVNKYGFLFQDLNQDEKQILGGGIVAVLGFCFLNKLFISMLDGLIRKIGHLEF